MIVNFLTRKLFDVILNTTLRRFLRDILSDISEDIQTTLPKFFSFFFFNKASHGIFSAKCMLRTMEVSGLWYR